jgi:anti-anti-sigma regulatory factor
MTGTEQIAENAPLSTMPRSFSLKGGLGIADASRLHASLVALLDEGGDVTVACDEAEHVDASVLQILLALKEALRQEGRTLQFAGLPPAMESFWRLTGVGAILLS